ncbi:uncharacterized mitochondrial protein AtMg00810-like [Vigna umbellata]|uniref:uncharacterized mitochondrial protein AtMg00810-like n=1 Tax=Vigna umbellata TaxID=87088 RepID=UPI001F5E3718|nr:uncharacterized mitochondrial protein AtMg00810-like [Vigna umbellata]
MTECNSTTIPIIANLKLTNQHDEKGVDASLYKQIVGSLRYICNNRSNINYGVELLSRFMNEPRQSHMSAAKHVLRYLKGTIDYSILFSKVASNLESTLEVWSDFDWSRDQLTVDNKSAISLSKNPVFHEEPSVPWKEQAYQHKVPLSERFSEPREN